MARFGFLSIAVVAIIIAIATNEASALKCWDCDSRSAFCGEFFDQSKLSDVEKHTLKECQGKCVKLISSTGNPVTSRMCANDTAANAFCAAPQKKFCEICDSDGCNGAAQYGPIALLIAIPVAIAHFLLL